MKSLGGGGDVRCGGSPGMESLDFLPRTDCFLSTFSFFLGSDLTVFRLLSLQQQKTIQSQLFPLQRPDRTLQDLSWTPPNAFDPESSGLISEKSLGLEGDMYWPKEGNEQVDDESDVGLSTD